MKNIILTAKRNYFKLKFKLSDNDFINCGVKGDTKKVQWYIDNGVDVDSGYQDGTNLLHYSCMAQNLEMISLLLKNNANPNLRDMNNRTPLLIIAHESSNTRSDTLSGPHHLSKDNTDTRKEKAFLIAKELIEYKADLNAVNSKGNTPLVLATYKENEKLVDLLLSQGADMFIKNDEGSNAFKCALNYKNTSIINSLIMAAKDTAQVDKLLETVNSSSYQNGSIQKTLNTIRLKMTMESDLEVRDEPKSRLRKI